MWKNWDLVRFKLLAQIASQPEAGIQAEVLCLFSTLYYSYMQQWPVQTKWTSDGVPSAWETHFIIATFSYPV